MSSPHSISDLNSHSIYKNPFLYPIFITALSILLAALLLFLAYFCWKVYVNFIAKIQCHICSQMVQPSKWLNGSHRQSCARENRIYLNNLPSPFDIRCSKCLSYLKLLPKDRGKNFKCDDRECPFGGRIRNNGCNRLHCFLCDFDICDSCIHRRLFVLTRVNAQSSPRTEITDSCGQCHQIPPVSLIGSSPGTSQPMQQLHNFHPVYQNYGVSSSSSIQNQCQTDLAPDPEVPGLPLHNKQLFGAKYNTSRGNYNMGYTHTENDPNMETSSVYI